MANLIGTLTLNHQMGMNPTSPSNTGLSNATNQKFSMYGDTPGDSNYYGNYNIFNDYILLQPEIEDALNGWYLKIGPSPITGTYEVVRIDDCKYNTQFESGAFFWEWNITRGILGNAQAWWSGNFDNGVSDGTFTGVPVELWDGFPSFSEPVPLSEELQSQIMVSYDSLPEPNPIVEKLRIHNHPTPSDYGAIYNFPEGYNENLWDRNINDSMGVPKDNDKFQRKDLYTIKTTDSVNEAIVRHNLQFEGDSFLKIENLYIQNTGVDGTTISNQVTGWIFTEAAYGGDPTQDGYSTISSKLKDEFKFYSQTFGDRSEGSDIGNITSVETEPIVAGFSGNATPIVNNFPGQSSNFGVDDTIDNDMFIPSKIAAFELSDIPEDSLLTSIFNEIQYNPLYIVIYTKGNKKVAWPINSDERKKKLSVFKINTSDFFVINESGNTGTTYQANFTSPISTKTAGGGSSNSAVQAAWRVSSLKITVNTSVGSVNSFSGVSNYRDEIDLTLPSVTVNENIFDSEIWLALLHPRMELSNNSDSAYSATSRLRHRPGDDFQFETYFGYNQNGTLGNNYVDLQSYYYDSNLVPKTSAPLDVTFFPTPHNITETPGNGAPGDLLFYYFVIDWDDKDNKFKTINDFLEKKPTNAYDYLAKQDENLYKLKKINYTQTTYNGLLSNVYATPGIKTIKFIIFSVWDGDGSSDDSPEFEVGMWYLCTSRIYLDIPLNQYPDFSSVGGNDYTTIPWPYTTPIIGGVSQDSKYKTSVQNALSSGNIGDSDIIDERFLIDDLDNDEMGKNIEQMDLEQIRYYNTGSYDMNTLLNIPYESIGIERLYNIDDAHLQTLEGYNGQDMSDGELGYFYPQQWTNYGRPDIADYILSLDEDVPRGGGSTGNVGGDDGQIMGGMGGGIFDAGGVIGVEGDMGGYVPQDIAPGQIAGPVGDYPDPMQLTVHSPEGGEKFQAQDSTLGYIDIIWKGSNFTQSVVYYNIQLFKKEINNTLSFVSMIVSNTRGTNIGQGKRKFRAYLGEYNFGDSVEGGVGQGNGYLLNPPAGDNYTIGVFRNINFPSGQISAYMGAGTAGTDNYDINNITTFRVVNPQEETPLVPGESNPFGIGEAVTDVNLEPVLFITTDRPLETFANPDFEEVEVSIITSYDSDYWDGSTSTKTFPEESSVGQIFISDNQDNALKQNCKLELNTGNITGKSIFDSSGNSNKGMLIGEYKVKKNKKNQPMKRDSFIKVPNKSNNSDGAL